MSLLLRWVGLEFFEHYVANENIFLELSKYTYSIEWYAWYPFDAYKTHIKSNTELGLYIAFNKSEEKKKKKTEQSPRVY